MRISKIKFYSFLMALVMLWSAMPIFSLPVCAEDVAQAAVTEDDLRAAVESQIRAFAKSINQSNADDAAAKALAKHGLSGGGKKLSVGKTHSLTATLWNSEVFQQALIDGCLGAVTTMQQIGLPSSLYIGGVVNWYDNQCSYHLKALTSAVYQTEYSDWQLAHEKPYKGKTNAYDSSLIWIAGSTSEFLQMERTKVTATEITYRVTVKSYDRFDFSTSSNSGFSNLISGLGALLFKEFDWESTVSFDLKVPYACTHTSGAYHWQYDPDSKTMISDSGDGYTQNEMIRHAVTNAEGSTSYYYELSQTVILDHSKPWVLEYDERNASKMLFVPFEHTVSKTKPSIEHSTWMSMFFYSRDTLMGSSSEYAVGNYYGTKFEGTYLRDPKQTFTFRLENQLLPSGENMVYLTVFKTDTGEVWMNHIPMDDHYQSVSGTTTLKSTASNWVSGKDFYINFIGRDTLCFSADYFDLRIWENGIDGGNGTYCTSKVTKPTCTKGGYTTYTCTLCGYSFTGDKTAAKGHTYKEKVTAPTCTEKGFTTYTCSCGDSYVDSYVEALSHSYKNGICSVCGEKNPVFFGDLDEDGVITTTDIVLLRRYIAGGYGVTLNPSAADLNGDGVLTSTDVVILRRYIAGGYGIELPSWVS